MTSAQRVLLPVRIVGTGKTPVGRAVSTAELAGQVQTHLEPAEIEARTGIATRHFVDAGSSAAELGARALRAALSVAGMRAGDLRRLIFVSSLGGETLVPATANQLAASLDLAGSCDCFDLNNSCMGFLSALDIGARSVVTGTGPVGIAVVELPTRYTTAADPRPYLVFGDAAVAAVLDEARPGEGILGCWLRNDGKAVGDVHVAHAGVSGRRETVRFTATNRRMGDDAVAIVRAAADAVLAQAGLTLAEVEWILPHQPNGALLEAIVQDLRVPRERVVPVVQDIGSVGAASIPMSLERLMNSGRVRAGDRILMVGVGAGISSGGILYRVAP